MFFTSAGRAVNDGERDATVEALLHVDGTCVDGANGSGGGDDDDACGGNDDSDWIWAASIRSNGQRLRFSSA